MNRIYIADAALSGFGKSKDSLVDIIREAVSNLNFDLKDIDAIFLGLMNPEGFLGVGNIASYVADKLGLSGKPAVRVETASSTGAAVLFYAYATLASGIYKNVLVLAAEKMTHLDTPRTTKLIAEVIDPYERKIGVSMPSLAAMVTNRFAYENKLNIVKLQNLLFAVAEKNHYYGKFNEYAQFRKVITKEDYLKSKVISAPLRLYDCSPISDGAAAMVISRVTGDIEIVGVGQGTDKQALTKREYITHFESTRKAAKQAYEMAGIGPDSIEFCEIHDAFTPFEITGLIDTGLCDTKKIYDFYLKKECYKDGKLPVNLSGGLKSRGHPVGASGLAQVVECYRIMTGKCDKSIIPKKNDVALTQSIGGLATNNFVSILKRKNALVKYFNIDGLKFKNKKGQESKSLRIYTYTILNTPPEGFESPLRVVMCEREGKKFMAKYHGDIKDLKIDKRVKILSKTEGVVTVTSIKRFGLKR
ncbi:thiolase family protein [Deferribacterales bacterium Es71-Z0220]|jgi:acetyl-CoA acetyltransferase|uniref:thiolase C-terminal domain-containing protein n=1 Tax=Deferrivibrio essentukiensis TaxID=2880922 RepID=UPI001F6044C4|nr:thiolase family protein [Deferrivibrio essentukiensis]MCB4203396.1 thiolase family protein [Deferrivibrio essentukiensis]